MTSTGYQHARSRDIRIQVSATWLKHDAQLLSLPQFRCLLHLGAFVDPWGLCWPASSRIAEALYDKPITCRQVRKLLGGLRSHGLLFSFLKAHQVTCHAVNRSAVSFGPEPPGYAWSESLLEQMAEGRCSAWSRPKGRDPAKLASMSHAEIAEYSGLGPSHSVPYDPTRLASWLDDAKKREPAAYAMYSRLTARQNEILLSQRNS